MATKLYAPAGTADRIRGPATGVEMKVIDGAVEVEDAADIEILVKNLGFSPDAPAQSE